MNKYFAISHSIPEYLEKIKEQSNKKVNENVQKQQELPEILPIEKVLDSHGNYFYKINEKFLTNLTLYRNVERVNHISINDFTELIPSVQQNITINISYDKQFFCDDLLNKRCMLKSIGNSKIIIFFVTNHQIVFSPPRTEIIIEGITC
jgi:hypothetical protein